MNQSLDMLVLLNGLAARVKASGIRAASSLDELLGDTGLDSLDTVLLSVYVCEVFGIAEETGKSLVPRSFADLVRFVEAHGKRFPASADEAFALVDGA